MALFTSGCVKMSLKHVILATLYSSDKTGYDLAHDIDGAMGFFWTATHQQIYKTLAELENDNLVKFKEIEQDGKPNKKVYKITSPGNKELMKWLHEEVDPQPAKDAFMIKIFMGKLVDQEFMMNELHRHKKIHERKIAIYKKIVQDHFSHEKKLSLDERYQFLTLRRGLLFEKAWLDWAKEIEESVGKSL